MRYPIELRKKALAASAKGYSKKAVNEMFGLGINTLKSWEKLEKETGSLQNKPISRTPAKIKHDELLKYCEDNPFATHVEAAMHFEYSEAAIRKVKRKLNITRKKKTPRYIERDELQRQEFVKTLENLPKNTEIFYADESGFEQSYSRTYGYSLKGKRVHGDVYGKRFARESVVGAIDADNNFFAGFAFKGYMNSDLFEGWLECIFVPAIKKKKAKNVVLILDNASHHPKERIQAIAEKYSFSVIFLPKYSPDFNPIEDCPLREYSPPTQPLSIKAEYFAFPPL